MIRVLSRLLTHDQLVEVFNAILRSLFEYASPVFLNPGVNLETRLYRLCKRAYRIIHGSDDDYDCALCNILEITPRRTILSMRLFQKAMDDNTHILHDLIPSTSRRSKRLILPFVRTSRRVDGFIFSCSVRHNEQL